MEDLKSELAIIFCKQAKLTVVGLEHQPSHKTFSPKPIQPRRYAGTTVAQNLWESSTNYRSNLWSLLRNEIHAQNCQMAWNQKLDGLRDFG